MLQAKAKAKEKQAQQARAKAKERQAQQARLKAIKQIKSEQWQKKKWRSEPEHKRKK